MSSTSPAPSPTRPTGKTALIVGSIAGLLIGGAIGTVLFTWLAWHAPFGLLLQLPADLGHASEIFGMPRPPLVVAVDASRLDIVVQLAKDVIWYLFWALVAFLFVFILWEKIADAPPVCWVLKRIGWGEQYDWDKGRFWERKFDTIVYWAKLFWKKVVFSWLSSIVFGVMFVGLQIYIDSDKYSKLAEQEVLKGHPWLQVGVPWFTAIFSGLLIAVPLLTAKVKEGRDKTSHQVMVEDHLLPYLDSKMERLAYDLMDIESSPGVKVLKGQIRAHALVVRRHWFNRYLVHLASSDPVKRNDREVAFLLDEGMAGWAYSRPGDLLVETKLVAEARLRETTRKIISNSAEVVCARAMAEDLRNVRRAWFNKVVGVILVASNDAADYGVFKTAQVGDEIHRVANDVGRLLADVRRAYEG